MRRPDGRLGYVPARAVVPAAEPLRRAIPTPGHRPIYLPRPNAGAPALDTLPARTRVAVLGEFGGYRLVRDPAGHAGLAAGRRPQSS